MKMTELHFKPNHQFLVCVDSDGCVFDNMELKHKECFCPATVNAWNLQGVSRYVRECAELVNLYSLTRGANRYPALVRTLELTYARKEVQLRGYEIPDLIPLREWIATAPILSVDALETYNQSRKEPLLARTIAWAREVDANIARIVRNTPPFPHVRETLEALRDFADIVIVSSTPHETILREWEEHDLLLYTTAVAGQELGSKAQCIGAAMQNGYAPDAVLMIGDAPGDHTAAEKNGVLFYPIVPEHEVESWESMYAEGAARLRCRTYSGDYMMSQLARFYEALQ